MIDIIYRIIGICLLRSFYLDIDETNLDEKKKYHQDIFYNFFNC